MKKASILIAAVVISFLSCKKNKPGSSDNPPVVTLDLPETTAEYFEGNGGSADDLNQKATLGRVLFYDGHLSVNNAIACASCHKQEIAFADNTAFSRGFENKFTGRNSPTIQNLSGGNLKRIGQPGGQHNGVPLFWDGRENNIQDLIARPILNHVEMGMTDGTALCDKLAALPYYPELFEKAYGSEDVTMDRISESMGLFISSIVSVNTRFDKFTEGEGELTAIELQGANLFSTKYECTNCHQLDPDGYSFAVNFLSIGLDKTSKDKGRAAVTRLAEDNGRFKLPNLRNIALTAPYMHDGRFNTLDEVLEHYSKGIQDDPNLAEELRDKNKQPMRMNISDNEKKAIIAFLGTLTDHDMITDSKFSNPFKVN